VGVQLGKLFKPPPTPTGKATAVFSPTPLTPGMLSEESPINASRSMICSGATPNFAFTPSTSIEVSDMVLTRVMCPSTNCAMSLSPVEITTGRSAAALLRARVPITSSASTPSTHSKGKPRARTLACSGSICTRMSSGMLGRLAL